MRRIDQRRIRLLKDGLAPFEARQISKRTEIRLADPELKALRKDRRADLRAAKAVGQGKREVNLKIAFDYRTLGWVDKRGRYNPFRELERVAKRPQVVKAIRFARVNRETSAGTEGRLKILRKAGFFPWEARLLATMKDIHPTLRKHTFESQTWQAMIRHHKDFMAKMLGKSAVRVRKEIGKDRWNALTQSQRQRLARQRLSKVLKALYAAGKYDVFSWLKIEYRPKRAPRGYEVVSRKQANKKLKGLLGTKRQAEMYFD